MTTNQKTYTYTARDGGFFSTLLLVFIVLKLTHTISWSWWWVLSPLWIPGVVLSAILFVIGMILVGNGLVDEYQYRQARKRRAARLRSR